MTGVQIYINDTEVVSNKEFTIKEEMLSTSSTILNNCYPKDWETDHDYYSRFFMPKDYSNCTIYRDGALIFAGILKNTGNILLRPSDPKFGSFQILDYKTLLSEGQTLDFVIANKTIAEAITQVTNAISNYGFVVGNIEITNEDDIIGAYSTLNKTPYDVYQYLAEISQARWFTRMIDDETVAIDFYSPELMTRADNIEYTNDYFEDNNIVDIHYSYSTGDYRNKQIILSDTVYGNIDTNENIIANGYQKNYTTEQKIGSLNHIYINGSEKTIGTITEKQLGIYADFYYSPGTETIETNDNYTAGTVINVIYTPLIKGRQIVYNNNEISRIGQQTGRNGTISRYETRNDVLSSDELNKIAQTYIKYKGTAEILLTIQTKDKDLFNIGEQTYFDIPELPALQRDYMVKTKETQITQTGPDAIIFYIYTLSSNYDTDTAINYFDNQRRKAVGNINEDEFITRNIDIENEVDIVFSDVTKTEITPEGNNELNSILNSPFIS